MALNKDLEKRIMALKKEPLQKTTRTPNFEIHRKVELIWKYETLLYIVKKSEIRSFGKERLSG